MKALIVLPTYNERENLEEIVSGIHRYAPDATILVVDDESPDGTGEFADELAHATDYVRVMHRRGPRGRGFAGVDGFQYALDHGYDVAVEMDADLSHDPKYLPDMFCKVGTADVVIGSRYTEGGREKGRSLARQYITRFARVYLRFVLGVPRVTDPTSGYRCFTRQTLQSIGLSSLRSPGPSIVTEILFRCRKRRIAEVPIVFNDRQHGESKFGVWALWDSIWVPFLLRLGRILDP